MGLLLECPNPPGGLIPQKMVTPGSAFLRSKLRPLVATRTYAFETHTRKPATVCRTDKRAALPQKSGDPTDRNEPPQAETNMSVI
jgi:hypothetical protein